MGRVKTRGVCEQNGKQSATREKGGEKKNAPPEPTPAAPRRARNGIARRGARCSIRDARRAIAGDFSSFDNRISPRSAKTTAHENKTQTRSHPTKMSAVARLARLQRAALPQAVRAFSSAGSLKQAPPTVRFFFFPLPSDICAHRTFCLFCSLPLCLHPFAASPLQPRRARVRPPVQRPPASSTSRSTGGTRRLRGRSLTLPLTPSI